MSSNLLGFPTLYTQSYAGLANGGDHHTCYKIARLGAQDRLSIGAHTSDESLRSC